MNNQYICERLIEILKEPNNVDIRKKISDLVTNIKLSNQIVPAFVATKKALLVGINYLGTPYVLNGCINDTISMKERLMASYGFRGEDIELMNDTTEKKPTKQNIIEGLKNLIANSKSGDTLVFLYSGHGSNLRDRNKDEWDGYDELIVPLDFNYIVDDELLGIVKTLKKGVNMLMIFDSCNSGSIVDLKYQYLDTMKRAALTINNTSQELAGNVVCISGCQDNQTSADAYIQNRYCGAMTWSLLESTKDNKKPTWNLLITGMRNCLKNGYSQIVQISSDKRMDLNSPIFL